VRWDSPLDEITALSFIVVGEWPEIPGTVTFGERTLSLAEAEERATREMPDGTERHLWLPLDPPLQVDHITLEAGDSWLLGALTLVDERLPGFAPMPANPVFDTTFSGDVKVYHRTDAPGRAWVVPAAQQVTGPEEAARVVGSATFDARAQVVVEEAARGLPAGGAGNVRWLQGAPEHLLMEVAVPEGGWLLLADAPFPGWQATVDGKAAEWYPANVINRALWLDAGTHRVEWRYSVPGLRWGIAGTVLGALLLLGLLVVGSRKRRSL
jgi:hypothetical protein